MNINEIYHSRLKTIPEALKLIKSNDFLVIGLGGSEPISILNELHTIKDNGVNGCELSNTLPFGNYEFMINPDYKDTVHVNGWFYTPTMRKHHQKGHLSFQPQHLHLALTKRLYAMEGRRKILLTTCSPMDKHGYISLSIGNTYEMQLIESGDDVVIVEVNENFPRTFGDNQIHVSKINAIVETDRPIPSLPILPFNEKDKKIGQYIADLIEDGSTIQLGIGGIPNAVAEALKVKKHLGIHTEMFTDGMVDLIECGAVDNSMKTLYKGKSVCTFALGTQKLYEYLDDNPTVLFMQGEWTNDPYVVGQNHKMVSINTTIEVDLAGQCCSESIGHKQFSGTGGQADTAIGAQKSHGGKSFIALYSTANVKNENGDRVTVSKIVPTLKQGAAISLSRNDVDYVVTEYGVAWLRGQSIGERVKRLINIAHPDFREELRFEADKLMFW
ncbi:acetyl-CoA hydrolase/transferase C-terminal domain-containing protein [Wukongibacter baidiensis]|uniref:acetyl-CoA hydrolase/transferase family protein n=1 Tax=Wukongibacter baidiensis TaxID=1723361 RepID=UPI003D7F48B4